jgi:hypothetical protein
MIGASDYTEVIGIHKPPETPCTESLNYTQSLPMVNESFIPVNRPLEAEKPVIEQVYPAQPPINIPTINYENTFSYTAPVFDPEPFSIGVPTPTQNVVGIAPNVTYAGNTPIYDSADAFTSADNWYRFPTQTGNILFPGIGGNVLLTGSATDLKYDGTSVLPSTWYNYPTESGEITFIDNVGTHTLFAQEGNLFYDESLLARADDIQEIADWALYPCIDPTGVDMNNYPIINASTITGTGQIQGGSFLTTGVIQGDAIFGTSLNVADGIEGTSLEVTGDISGQSIVVSQNATAQTLNILPTGSVTPCILTTNPAGNTLFVNGNAVSAGASGDITQWATKPAVATIEMQTNNINNVGSIISADEVGNQVKLGGALFPLNQNFQYALETYIQTTSPLNSLTLASLGQIFMTSGRDMSITVATGDFNILCPDFNVTMTDATSFMNFTSPGGVTIAGAGLFIASGVLECLGIGDITLVSAGNIRIGSGNTLGATTEIEKFSYNDDTFEPLNGIFSLKLKQIKIINVPRDAGSQGFFSGVFEVECYISSRTTITSKNSSSQKVFFTVQADQGDSVYKAMNLTSVGTGPLNFNMVANGGTMTMTYNSGNTLTLSSSSGSVVLAGLASITTAGKGTFGSATIGDGGVAGSLVLNATATPIVPTQVGSTYIDPVRQVSPMSAKPAFYNPTTKELTYSSVANGMVIGATTTTALSSLLRGTTYVLTSGATQNFTTADLTGADTGFFVYVKNSGPVDMEIAQNGVPFGKVFFAKANTNSAIQIVYWDGVNLVLY